MEWPSGSLGLVGDFELRIIPRRDDNYTPAAIRQARSSFKQEKGQTGMSVPPETCWAGSFLTSPLSLKYPALAWSRGGREVGRTLYRRAVRLEQTSMRGRRARTPWACGHEAETRAPPVCLTVA